MCATCKSGYGKSNKVYCVPCSDNPMYYVISALITIGAILFIILTIRSTLKEKVYLPEEPKYFLKIISISF